jgi:hypothetical protein
MKLVRDRSLDTLLDLNDEVIVVGDGPYWTKFIIKRVPVSKERPHGLHYSLTLHNDRGDRVLGFDNAHAVQEGSGPGAKARIEHDHRHYRETVRRYEYTNAGALMADFWQAVFAFLETEKED